MVVELAKRTPYLSREIDQRDGESGKRRHKQHCDTWFVLNRKEGARKSNDHHERYDDAADCGPEDRPVQHRRTPHQAADRP
jgi:hypothetical protein